MKLGEEGGGREKETLGKLVKNDQEIKKQVFLVNRFLSFFQPPQPTSPSPMMGGIPSILTIRLHSKY